MPVTHEKDANCRVSDVAGIMAQLILCLGAPKGVHFQCRIILEVTVTVAYLFVHVGHVQCSRSVTASECRDVFKNYS